MLSLKATHTYLGTLKGGFVMMGTMENRRRDHVTLISEAIVGILLISDYWPIRLFISLIRMCPTFQIIAWTDGFKPIRIVNRLYAFRYPMRRESHKWTFHRFQRTANDRSQLITAIKTLSNFSSSFLVRPQAPQPLLNRISPPAIVCPASTTLTIPAASRSSTSWKMRPSQPLAAREDEVSLVSKAWVLYGRVRWWNSGFGVSETCLPSISTVTGKTSVWFVIVEL